MTVLRRAAITSTLLFAAAAIAAAAAAGDGGPSPGISFGGDGITGPGGALRYVTIPTDGGTIVETIRVSDSHVLRWTELRGDTVGIPYVTSDGATGGLTRDLRTLILAGYATAPGNKGSSTSFALFDTRSFRVTRTITLAGTYSYDAIAPDASTLYLIQYTSSRNWNRYRVRAYDLVHGRLLRGAVVDKREPAEAMQGSPMTRATSGDGRWVYTLYDRSTGSAFIHALDTRRRAAVCIDLPWHVTPGALFRVHMSVTARGIEITQRAVGTLATVDTRTFRVSSRRSPGKPVG